VVPVWRWSHLLRKKDSGLSQKLGWILQKQVGMKLFVRMQYINLTLWMFHPDGQLIQFNSMLLDFTGYSGVELEGKNLADISHPDDISIDHEKYTSLLKREIESYTAERRLLKKEW